MSDKKNGAVGSLAVADRSEEFVAVQGGQETSSAAGLLTTAYVLMWLAVFVFVWLTSKKLQGVQGRISELEEALKKADAKSVEQAAASASS